MSGVAGSSPDLPKTGSSALVWIHTAAPEPDPEPATADSIAALVSAAAVAEAELAARAVAETQAAVLAAAHTVAQAAAAAAIAVARAVEAKAAVVAAAAAAAAEARLTEARLTHNILHDSLTGLPNRRLLVDRLTQSLARARRGGTYVAVLYLDLNDFKTVNDTLGHAAGDELLVGVAERLLRCIRDTDTCARIGGDEFVIVCEDLGLASEGARIVVRVQSALAEGVRVSRQVLTVRASIGLAISSLDSGPLDLIHDADTAMYQAKKLAPAQATAGAPHGAVRELSVVPRRTGRGH